MPKIPTTRGRRLRSKPTTPTTVPTLRNRFSSEQPESTSCNTYRFPTIARTPGTSSPTNASSWSKAVSTNGMRVVSAITPALRRALRARVMD